MIAPPIRTLVVEDEPLARQALHTVIAAMPDLEWIGEAHDGVQAAEMIERLRPELVFLDVELPGMSGIDVLSAAKLPMVVIFTTAHDDHALTAFELGAIDYLLKPFGRARVARAVERAIPQLEALRTRRGEGAVVDSLVARMTYAREDAVPVSEIFVRDRGSVVPVAIADVTHFEADGDYVAVHARGRRHLVYVNLGDLAERLDRARFMRVHRSHIVSLACVATLSPIDANRVTVHLRDGSHINASRTGTRALRQWMRARGG